MKSYKIADIEANFGVSIKRNFKVIGVDTATRTGICVATTDNKTLTLEYNILDLKHNDKFYVYNNIIKYFEQLLDKSYNRVVVEETFFSTNAKVFCLLSRLGAMVYTVAKIKGIDDIKFLSAVQARKGIGLKGRGKKSEVHKAFKLLCPFIEVTDIDVVDGLILALNGIIETNLLEL